VVRRSGYVSESARAMVLKSIEAVGYRPSAVGRSLRAARTPMIGLVITDIANPFYARIHKAVEATFRDHGLTVMLLNSDDNRAVERQQLDLLSSYSPSGLLLAPAVESTLTDRDLAQFGNCVLISRTQPYAAEACRAVCCDQRTRGGRGGDPSVDRCWAPRLPRRLAPENPGTARRCMSSIRRR